MGPRPTSIRAAIRPELKADLERAKAEAKAFEADYKGKLEGLARNGGLIDAIKRIEA